MIKNKKAGRPVGGKNQIYGIQSARLIEILNKTFAPAAVIPIHSKLAQMLKAAGNVVDKTNSISQAKEVEQKPQVKVVDLSKEI